MTFCRMSSVCCSRVLQLSDYLLFVIAFFTFQRYEDFARTSTGRFYIYEIQ